MRFPLTILVVIEHVFNSNKVIVGGYTYDPSDITVFGDVMLFIESFVRGVSVPAFFFISGYVFFYGIENYTKNIYAKKLQNRIKTLLIPYILWNSIEIVIDLLKCLSSANGFATYGTKLNLSLENILSCFWAYNGRLFIPIANGAEIITHPGVHPINTPLWFVRDLMVVVLFSPILYYLLRRTKLYFILLLAAIWLSPDIRFGSYGFSEAFLFFSFGAYLSMNKKDIIFKLKSLNVISVIAYPVASILYFYAVRNGYNQLSFGLKSISILGFIFFAYNLSRWLLEHGVKYSTFLTSSCFFIYISHVLLTQRTTKLMYMILRPNGEYDYIFVYILSVFVTVGSLLLVYKLMKRFMPSVLAFVTGRKPYTE